MRKTILVLATVVLAIMTAQPAAAADPSGDWMVENRSAIIRIARCGDLYWGIVVWEREPGRDSANPDPAKRNRPTLGIPILLGLKATGDNRWEGKVYNAENGSLYMVRVSLASPDVLRIEGCILGGIFCGGQNWTRARVPDDQVAQTQGRGAAKGSKGATGAQTANVCAAAARG